MSKRANPPIKGYCPACGSSTLFAGVGGHLTCSLLGCPDPCAADRILDDRETEHIVLIADENFNLQHPLRERGEDLFSCTMHERLSSLAGPPVKPGRYRVTLAHGEWTWMEVRAGRAAASRRSAVVTSRDGGRICLTPSAPASARGGTPTPNAAWSAGGRLSRGRRTPMSDPLRTELLRILKERWDCDTPEQALAAYPADSSAARTARVLLDAGSQQAWQNGTLCPDAPVCESCPCAEEDDACFPGDRLRAERDLYRDTLHDLTSMRKAHS